MDYTKQSPALLSICSGGLLGLEKGFDEACDRLGWQRGKPVTYVEIEAFLIENLVKQMEQGVLAPAPVWSNLKTFNARPFRNRVDAIFGGYPCQPFSTAGKRKGTEDSRHLWPYIRTAIHTIRPVFCFFENVPGHLTLGYGTVKRELEDSGYTVNEGIFSAEEIGAPHLRKRLYILAIRNDQLANAYSNKSPQIRRNISEVRGLQKTKRQSGHGPPIPDRTSEKLGNTIGQGLERHPGNDSPEIRRQDPVRPIASTGFPMGQGVDQYDWEQDRIISRLDLTVNGHDFTEDLLRMAGNGVVHQTAELAFLTLLKKFDS